MIYIGSFLHATNQEEQEEAHRRHGEFNMIVEATDQQTAINMFKERLLELRENSNFFEGVCSIFFVHLLEFEEFPQNKAKMLYYKSVAGDPVMPFIGCAVPSSETDGCKIYTWGGYHPEIDGQTPKIFLEFKA
ncbi:MAG: hypothetical protein JSW39_14585 [Desulfobacterales bacterium]|nr:MAG: hypothetical protein JSW39_14585 [Desulfobacterales bacterium]